MKHVLILLICTFLLSAGLAQSLERQVIGVTGNYSESPDLQLSATVGEMAVVSFLGGQIHLLQGFQQPGITVLPGIGELMDAMIDYRIWPNPTTGIVNFSFTTDQIISLSLYVTDMQGRVVWQAPGDLSVVGGRAYQADLGYLPSGMYLLTVSEPLSGAHRIFKIEKH
jgi:hypothetical protein